MVDSNIIKKNTEMKREQLDKYHYTISLLKTANRTGLISAQTIINIQTEIMLILKELILSYTGGQSSSVSTETAENLLNSILYTIDAYLQDYKPAIAVHLLQQKGIKQIYQQGISCLQETLVECRGLYQQIKKNRLLLPMEIYNTAIDHDLSQFFINYEILFAAHDIPAGMLDYPLIFDDMNVQGVFYIKYYLQNLFIENEFCQFFNLSEVNRLLINYGRIYGVDYQETPYNIFEVVCNNALFYTLLNKTVVNLKLNSIQYEILNHQLTALTASKIEMLIEKTTAIMIDKLTIEKDKTNNKNRKKLHNYLFNYQEVFCKRLITACKNNNLDKIIVTEDEVHYEENSITFVAGQKMNDQEFLLFLNKLKETTNINDKLLLIRLEINSLQDFMDLLTSNFLYADEYSALFNTLSEMELAILGKEFFFEDIKTKELSLTTNLKNKLAKLHHTDPEWLNYYLQYLQGLENSSLSKIEHYLKNYTSKDLIFS